MNGRSTDGCATNGLPRIRFARGRRGFAMVLALGMLAMMLTFLIAAQTSVMMSHRNARRSAERSDAGELRARALSLAARRVGEGAPASLPPVEIASPTGTARAEHRTLAPDDPIYAPGSGLAHREGDALVTVAATTGKGVQEERAYVVNGAGRRRGAVRVR